METNQSPHFTIKQWAEEDRPREKLLLKGKASLSEAELLGILIGSGTKKHSAVDIAKIILATNSNNLNNLAKLSVKELTKFEGIGEARAITIVSALELGRRRKNHDTQKIIIKSADDVYDAIRADLQDLRHEEFWVLFVKRNNELITKERISIGGTAGTVVDTKIILKKALDHWASSIILIHNHPSGNKKPSSADITLTKKLKEAARLMDIMVLDHLIFTNDGYFSFADESLL